MKQNYNYFKYWENMISENKTIRGHMFMNDLPNDKSLYIHTLIFTKKSGIENVYAYFPNEKTLLGYIQYSFLQEAFYKWIYGKKGVVTKIPPQPVEDIIDKSLNLGLINNEVYERMMDNCSTIKGLWDYRSDSIIRELSKFSRKFNKTWFGDNKEFLYMKVFKTPSELGEFVIDSIMITGDEEEFKRKVGISIDKWRQICKGAVKDRTLGKEFRMVLQRKLTEII